MVAVDILIHDIINALIPLYACSITALIIIILNAIDSADTLYIITSALNRHEQLQTKEKKQINSNNKVHFESGTIDVSTKHEIATLVKKEDNVWKQLFAGHWSVISREGFNEV